MKRNVRSLALLSFLTVLIVSVHFTNRYVVEEQEQKGQLVSGISEYCLELAKEENVQIAENLVPTVTNCPKDEQASDIDVSEENTDAVLVEEAQAPSYSEEDVDLLAHVIYAEIGSDWVDDMSLYYVGSVVINRVNSDLFPNTIHDVVYQKGQYECAVNGHLKHTATERCFTIARDLLENGSVLPEMVLYQAEFKQGPVFENRCGLYFCYQR